jgi:hypothetical protein
MQLPPLYSRTREALSIRVTFTDGENLDSVEKLLVGKRREELSQAIFRPSPVG